MAVMKRTKPTTNTEGYQKQVNLRLQMLRYHSSMKYGQVDKMLLEFSDDVSHSICVVLTHYYFSLIIFLNTLLFGVLFLLCGFLPGLMKIAYEVNSFRRERQMTPLYLYDTYYMFLSSLRGF